MTPYQDIYEQYVDEASFLWVLRSIAVNQPHYYKPRIEELEGRIEAQLDGLMTSVEEAWEICAEALKIGESGEAFVAAVIAFRSHDVKKIQLAIESGLANEETIKGLVSALGWLPAKLINSWIEKLLASKDLDHKYLAIAACSVRRINPGEGLTRIVHRDDCRQHNKLYDRALRLIGEVRRQDLMPELERAMQSDQPEVIFWANWSSVLLGNRSGVLNLKPFVFQQGVYQQKAINLCFRVLPIDQARQWVGELGKDIEQSRAVIKSIAVMGDPHAVDWLISKMEQPATARLAAEAFTSITGVDLEQRDMVLRDEPAVSQQSIDDDEDVELDEDENLPRPDVSKIKVFWASHRSNFISGQRYFMGLGISSEWLKEKLMTASQRQRHAAAIELALIEPGISLPNTKGRAGA